MIDQPLFIDFRGTPQAAADIAAVARELPSVERVSLTSESGGEIMIKPGYSYDEVATAIHTALHERWPQRYGDDDGL